MWVCDWLCPKRKKKEEPYDVHEDTFEMDQHIGQLDLPEKHEEETKKAEKLYQQSSQQLTVGTI